MTEQAGKKGVWNSGGGFEYNAVLLAALFALTEQGPGALSVDEAAFPRLRGRALAAAQLGAALAASHLVTSELVNRPPEEEEDRGAGVVDVTGDGAGEPERVAVAA